MGRMGVEEADEDERPLAVRCRAWLRGSSQAFPARFHRGGLQIDADGIVWRSMHRWQPPIGLDPTLVEVVGRRAPSRMEALRIDRGCTVFVLRYLTVQAELAVGRDDAPVVHTALERRR